MIVDAHLDIAWGAVARGHGFLGSPPPGFLISRQTLVAADVGLIFATLYCAPAQARRAMRTRFVYENAHEANLMATAQVNYYRSCGLDLIGDRAALAVYARGWKKGKLAAVLLMEGADPIETPAQLGAWTDRGVRIIGPAWGGTRYSGGTGAPGGLTDLGRQLLKAMRRKHVILDLSHMADQAVADAFATWRGPIMASHSNAREIVPGDRQLTSDSVAEIARRGGMVGVSFYGHHLRASGRVTLNDVVMTRGPLSRMIEIDVTVDDVFVCHVKADGLIVATATGSTAYNLSAGGPIVYPTMGAVVITPICPHMLTNRPIVLPDTLDIEIGIATKNQEIFLTLDGQEGLPIGERDRVCVRKSAETVRMVQSPDKNYFDVLRTKLKWGES